jgi:hypothetical protein
MVTVRCHLWLRKAAVVHAIRHAKEQRPGLNLVLLDRVLWLATAQA